MSTHYDTVVIGAGQAGLAAGYHLSRAGARFLILDGGRRIGESWRRRWDSLRLFTPNRHNGLPGLPFPGDPSALPGKDEVADYLEGYAARLGLPVQLEARVSALDHGGSQFVVRSTMGNYTATSVIVATGAFNRPHTPAFGAALSSGIHQLHSSDYQSPSQLPEGDVLVVGAGNSGAQIAIELAATRRVWLSGRDTGHIPRRVLGRDVYDWLWPTVMQRSAQSWLGRRLTEGRLFAGDPLVGLTRRDLERSGVVQVGRTIGVRDALPVVEARQTPLDIAAVVWCTGFRPRFDWIHLPVFGSTGYPVHDRGIVRVEPRLAFLGLRFQSSLSSSLLGGVGEDAALVVSALVEPRRAAA
jgi:putative flavoprotein involved in K+ transport